MQNAKNTPATDTAIPATVETAKPAKRSRNAKAKPATPATPAKKPAVHAHRESGFSDTYTGLSPNLNNNRPVAVKLSLHPASTATLTPRAHNIFSDIRAHYGNKPFPARGIDNANLAKLHNAGLLNRVPKSGKAATDASGVAVLIDAPNNALRYTVSAAGVKFGNA